MTKMCLKQVDGSTRNVTRAFWTDAAGICVFPLCFLPSSIKPKISTVRLIKDLYPSAVPNISDL